ncbi:nickel pincer cofactor biosynthesis protein LarC [Synechococcus sp. PCC 7336]|uniref:nickel pincer cofactor biosynthesis protein LarC n=1 Tax=Synechococcus sp. PCC 7336 TaxID=195250 RepID=UPI00035C6E7B|nr:nickel pincer cofactor biosynthesis protein LarC [Synechococcus sp. PCC 7336]
MKLAYLDCAAGIAGDMCLGALLDCGLPLDYLEQELSRLHLEEEYELQVHSVTRSGVKATQAIVQTAGRESPSRHWPEIQATIASSSLSPTIAQRSLDIFRTLGQAEAAVHGQSLESVHFHEVGAVDATIDIVGTCIGLDWLQVERIIASPQPVGGGWANSAHGKIPVPVPAVMQLWQDFRVPVFSNGVESELVTPTGAAISVSWADGFGPCPPMQVEQVGVGAGTKDLPLPNVLRLWVGDSLAEQPTETIAVLETQIDDVNPQVVAYTFERLFEAGALDVFSQPVTMKQNRPGTLVTAICPPHLADRCEGILFEETTTIGIRRSLQQRSVLEREIMRVETPYGSIQMKVARRHAQVVNAQPEFSDCAALARKFHIPVQQVWLAAQAAWHRTAQL